MSVPKILSPARNKACHSGALDSASASSCQAGATCGFSLRFWRRHLRFAGHFLPLLLGALSLLVTSTALAQASTKTYTLTPSVSADEGSAAELTVTLGEAAPVGGLAFDVIYDYSVSSATAADTGTTPSTLTVSQGSTTATLTVPITAERSADTGETFTVTITPASGVVGWSVASGGTDTSTVTIVDDAARITLDRASYVVLEEAGSARISYTWSGLSYVGLSRVGSTWTHGTTTDDDYSVASNERSFNLDPFSQCSPGQCGPNLEPIRFGAQGSFSFDVTDDDLVEGDETFTLTLVPPTGWSAKPVGSATVTIRDNEAPRAKIAFGSDARSKLKHTASVTENVSGGTLNVPVTVSHLPQSATTFVIEVLNTSTATGGIDYRIGTSSVTFDSTDNTKTKNLSVTITNDSDSETSETIELRIAAADETVDDLGDHYSRNENSSLATLTIADDDVPAAPVELTFTPGDMKLAVAWSVPEGPLTGYDVHYTSATPSTVADGVAVQAGSDDTTGWVDAGHTGLIAEQEITGLDNDRAYRVRIRAKNGIGNGAWLIETGTPAPQPPSVLTLSTALTNDTTVESVGTLTVTATLNRPVITGEVTVTLAAGFGTSATASDDYVMPAAFSIAAGERVATADVRIVDDDVDEDNENLVLTAVTDGLTVADVTLTIVDDDTAGVSVSTQTLSASAGGTVDYTVVLDSKPNAPVTVAPASSAKAIATVSTALTFTPSNWSTAQPVTVTGVAAGSAVVSHTVTSTDPNYPSTLAIDSVNVAVSSSRTFWITPAVTGAEGGDAVLTVTLGEAAPSGGLTFDVSYDYSVSGATADDTGMTPSTVTVSRGSTTATISVPLTTDRNRDAGETFTVTITPTSGVTGWSIGAGATSTSTVTIVDNAGSVTFREATYSFKETDGSRSVWYYAQALSYVGLSLGRIVPTDGTATGGGVDFNFTEQPFGFNPYQALCQSGLRTCGPDLPPHSYRSPDRSTSIGLVNDRLVEGSETFTLEMVPPVGWSAMPNATVLVTITDDDADVAKIAFGTAAGGTSKYTASVDENITGGILNVPVTVNRLPGSPTTFDIDVLGTGTAIKGIDYRINPASVTFGPSDGSRTKNLKVVIVDDTALEPSETIELQIAAADQTVDDLGDHYARDENGSRATLTIANDDIPLPTFSPDGNAIVTNANRNITLTFESAIKKDASGTDFANGDLSGILTLRSTDRSGTFIPFTPTINSAGTIIKIDPDSSLADGVVFVAISNQYYDTDGNQGGAASVSFTIDATAPSPVFSPLDRATVADPATNITLTFAEAVKRDSRGDDFNGSHLSDILTLKKTDSNGEDIAYAASIDTAKKVITIDPASNLEGGLVYVAISNAYYDAVGNRGSAASAIYTVRATVPTRLEVTAGNAKLKLEWVAPTGTLTGYDVHYTSAPKSGTGMVADSAVVQTGATPAHTAGWVDAEHSGTGASIDITGLTNGAAYRVRVRGKNQNQAGDWVFGSGTPRSDDATLSALVVTGSGSADGSFIAQTLKPDFASSTTVYTSTVTNAVTHVKLTPTTTDRGASVTVGGSTVASGSASAAAAINLGANEIEVAVTAEDGSTQTYTVTITRQSGDATLSALAATSSNSADGTFAALTLKPVFSASTTAYTATVANSVTHAKLTPTVTHGNASVTVAGTAVTSGSSSGAVALNVGANAIAVVVTAEDGSAQTYTVTITRQSNDATLSALVATSSDSADGTFAALTLKPTFSASTTAYTATVASTVTHAKLTPTVNHADASVTVAGAAVSSGSASEAVALNVGANAIALVVTAEDDSMQTYTVTITRQSGDATLSALAASGSESADGRFAALTLKPVFSASTTAYTATVGSTVTHAKLTPTVTDANASVTVAGTTVTSGSASAAAALSLGANEIAVVVSAEDGSTQTYTVTITRQSGDATLSALVATTSESAAGTFAALTLTPVFSSSTSAYAATVASTVTHAKLTPTVTDSDASVTVAGRAVTSGSTSDAIALNEGANAITVVVTAEDGSTQTYTVTIKRKSSDATLSALAASGSGSADGTFEALTLKPVFSASTTAYTATVASTVTHVKLTPTVTNSNASVTVAGTTVTSGSASGAAALSLGANAIAVVVTAEDDSTKTYTVTITRQSGDATLSALAATTSESAAGTFTALTLTPVFSSSTTAYAATVASTVTHAKLTPTVTDSDASVTVAGNAVTSGSASGAVVLNEGANAIAVVVTAEDGSTKTYTVTIKRKSSDATLSALAASGSGSADGTFTAITLKPVFSASTTAYTATVARTVTHAKLTPTVSNSNASVTVAGTTVTSGSASGAAALNVGANEIAVVVTAEDDSTKTYTVTITRQSTAANSLALTTSATNDTVAENGGSVTITATLNQRAPIGGVSVTLSAGTGTDATSGSDYTISRSVFTIPANEDSATTVVTIVNDDIDENDESLVLTATAGSFTVTGVTLTITDDDTAGVSISEDKLGVGVGSDYSAIYRVKLDSQPSGNVTVTPTSSDTTKATVSSAVEFTPTDWYFEQEVTVTGVAVGDATVTHSITASTDAGYPTSLSIDSVAVEVTAGICGRTAAVQNELIFATGQFDCKGVANVHLAKVTGLSIWAPELAALKAGDLDGLTGLENLTVTAALTSLLDLSHLVKLKTLDVSQNQLTSLPSLSKNTKLTVLSVQNNQLTSLPDLSALVSLEGLNAGQNQLTSLPDLSKNVELETLLVNDLQLTSLPDLSRNTKLLYFDVYNNPLATLSSLSLTGSDGNPVSLKTEFDADTTEYAADAGLGVTSVTVTLTATDTGVLPSLVADANPAPTIYVTSAEGRQKVTSGSPSPAIALTAAENVIDIEVEGRGGSYQRYAVTVNANTKNYTLSPATIPATEGFDALLTVTLGENAPTGGLEFDVTYDYSGSDATTADTGETPTTVTVAEDTQTADLLIPIAADAFVEGVESFTVTIATSNTDWAASGAGVKSTITITDAFASVAFGSSAVSISKYTATVAEDVTGGTLEVPVTVSHLPLNATTFAVQVLATSTATEYVDATNPNDFRIITKSVTFGRTDTSKTKNVAVTITDDMVLEPDETIELMIAAADTPIDDLGDIYFRHASGSLATLTIEDDEVPPAPTDLVVTAGESRLAFTWTAPTLPSGVTLTGYDAHYTTASAVTATDDAAVQSGSSVVAADGWVDAGHSGVTTSHTLTGVINGTEYRLRVRAKNKAGESAWLTNTGTPTFPSNSLVSNVGQSSSTNQYQLGNFGFAQCFTTGSASGGYRIGSVELNLASVPTIPAGERKQIDVELWSAAASGLPNQKLLDLTTPSRLAAGNVEFLAPAMTTFAANTSYCVVFNQTSTLAISWSGTTSKNEDASAAAGWSIADNHSGQISGTWFSLSTAVLQIRVNFMAKTALSPPTQLTLSTDATNDTVAEGVGTVTVTATLDEPAGSAGVSVTLSADSASTATATDDYTLPNAFTIASGEVAATADVDIKDDSLVEGNETLVLTATAGSLTVVDATLTITDDEAAAAKIAFGSNAARTSKYTASVVENVSGGTLDVPVAINHLPQSDTTFVVEVLNTGTATEYVDATNPNDFRIATKSVMFGPTDTEMTKNLSVTITNDSASEPSETIALKIAAADQTVDDLGDHYARDENGSLATLTITNDDIPAAPTDLRFTLGNSKLGLTWTAPDGPLTGYDVHYTSATSGTVADGATVQEGSDETTGWVNASHTGTTAAHEITGLDNGTVYRVRVRAKNGNGDSTWLTGTGMPEPPDETPPMPQFKPKNGEAVSDTGTNITVAFDEAVKKGSDGADFSSHADLSSILTLKSNSSTGSNIEYTASINTDKTVITIDPVSALNAGTVYVAISDGYYDEVGNQGEMTSATFTVDTTPPVAPTFNPVNGQKVQNPSTNITLTFAEVVKKDSDGADFSGHADLAIVLKLKTDDENGNDIGYTASIDTAKKVVTIDPSSDLPAGEVYVAVTGGYYDTAGNQGPSASVTFNVRPVRPTGLTVTSSNRRMELSWTAPEGTVTGYDVHYTFASSSGTNSVADNASVQTGQSVSAANGWVNAGHSGMAASQSITGLTTDKTYRVRVRAKNTAGRSDWLTGTHALREMSTASPGNVLVSNVGQTDTDSYAMQTLTRAQCFTTGSTTGGYAIGSVDLDLSRVETLSAVQKRQIDVELWSSTTDGSPSASIRQLYTPSSVTAGNIEFTASAGTTLAANTTYCVVFRSTNLDKIDWAGTSSSNEDTGAATGWSIANRHRVLRGPQYWPESGNALQIRVNVNAVGDTTPPSPMISPPDGRKINNAARNITLTFTEGIRKNSGGSDLSNNDLSSILTLKVDNENGAAIAYSASISTDKTVITIDPTMSLVEGDVYVAISDDYYDTAGNRGLAAKATFTVDTTSPAAPDFSPSNGTTVKDASTNITLTFAEAVKKNDRSDFSGHAELASILTLRTDDENGNTIAYAASIDDEKKVITLNPSSDLDEGMVYVAISDGYYDEATNQGAMATATFTVDTTGPTAPTFLPANEAKVTNAATNITLTFAEVVKKDAQGGDFTDHSDLSSILMLKKTNSSGDDINYAASINTEKTVITLNPSSNLDGGAVYVAVSNGYYDAVGNQGTAASVTFAVTPAAPTGLMVVRDDAQLDLSWTAPSGTVTGYDVHYTSLNTVAADADASGNDPSAAWVDDDHSGTDPEHEITELDNGTAYRLRVRAKNAAGNSAWLAGTGTPDDGDTTAPTVSFAPTNNAMVNDVDTNIVLTFSEAIRKDASNTELTNADLSAILTLKTTNVSGSVIQYAATINRC